MSYYMFVPRTTFRFSILAILAIGLAACGGDKKPQTQSFEVNVHALSDPGALHPLITLSNTAGILTGFMFQPLIDMDAKTLELVPILAKSRPEIEEIKDGIYKGGMKFTYELRPEATWDNGAPIKAKDIDFSLRVLKNPLLNDAAAYRQAFFEIDSIYIFPDNDRKFSIYFKDKTIRAEPSSGNFPVIPAYIYDPEGIMNGFTVHQLNDTSAAAVARFEKNPALQKYAKFFADDKFKVNKDYIAGSGAYELEEWATGQHISLKRKKDWWGDKVKNDANSHFEAFPDKLVYKIINDPQASLTALKAGKLDVEAQIPPRDFMELKSNTRFLEKFNLYTPQEIGFVSINLNVQRPGLKEVAVRKALAHLLDIDNIIKSVLYDLNMPTVSMESPANKAEYNSDIKRLPFDPEAAKKLLTEAGWKDLNGDGILDKMTAGKRVHLEFELLLNSGNPVRKDIANLFEEAALKAGVKINVVEKDLKVLVQRQRQHDFDMAFNGWIGAPLKYDPQQIWHTRAIREGNNFMGWGDASTDALIDSIRTELDDSKRIPMFKRFQAIVYDQMPVLYLYNYSGKLAISKKYKNAEPSLLRPGYDEASFRIIE